jgi:plastocyanin
MMKNIFICCLAYLLIAPITAQCTADFDFGTETYGSSPNPSLGEQFTPGIVNEPYYDVLHMLIPQYVLEIDSTLPFSPDAILDSIKLVNIVMVDLNDTLSTYSLSELGLEIVCNNNGDSGLECSFLGGNQYCVSIEGTPNMVGNFRADITVSGCTDVFGFPFCQEQLFGSLNLDIQTLPEDVGCTADYDFGSETYGSSPNPSLGEQFTPGIVNEPYYDVLHMLIPEYVLEIDSTLPFSPDAILDSIKLVNIVMVDLNDTLSIYSLSELGLQIVCNNNGDSGLECSFLGGNQYCVSLEGTPTMAGNFRADITVSGCTDVFGFPFCQEQLFGSLNLDIGVEGCMDPNALNYDPAAVIDDGSCLFDACNLGGVEVSAMSFSFTNADLTVNVGDLVYWVNYGGMHDVNGDIDSQTGISFGNPEAFGLPTIAGSPDGACMGSHTFTLPGVYNYDCSVGSHAALGMVGTITVGVGGCLDSSASNYNSAADYDDGSCESVVACFGDLNNDNSVTVADLLLILSEFGCLSGCTTDINNDGVTTVADLLELLSVFGTTC